MISCIFSQSGNILLMLQFFSTCTAIKDGLTVHLVIRSANKVSPQSISCKWFEYINKCRNAVLITFFLQKHALHKSRGKQASILHILVNWKWNKTLLRGLSKHLIKITKRYDRVAKNTSPLLTMTVMYAPLSYWWLHILSSLRESNLIATSSITKWFGETNWFLYIAAARISCIFLLNRSDIWRTLCSVGLVCVF